MYRCWRQSDIAVLKEKKIIYRDIKFLIFAINLIRLKKMLQEHLKLEKKTRNHRFLVQR
jgi:hypothetical protein